ncbi:unnamed protein product [Arabidopsis lyrata]|uniref:Uncharacterized protein n=1 Tax=Arabidopsis lyrata subsp. lyrata TaxID=81972 RepID=D7MTR1_ARALL|nr:hypothetical protein ARALYDRAFT_918538 [Arabidopsis lyrata subsp. lyrata]CAH8279614.1 unnamed protein product [Arabidopsis lyrata]
MHDIALYNSDSRLISLEFLPMQLCDDVNVTIHKLLLRNNFFRHCQFSRTCQTAVQPPRQGRTEPSNDPLQHRMRPKMIVAVNHALIARSWFINQG